MPALLLRHDLGDGASLRPRDLTTVDEMHALTVANLDRLRPWEGWARDEPTVDATYSYARQCLENWAAGTAVPLVLALDDRLVGNLSARLDRERGIAEVGYWVGRDAEGRGLVRRGVQALVAHVTADLGFSRVEIRTAAHNTRSRALAERLGFLHEGTLIAGHPVGAERHDLAIYVLVPAPTS